MTHWATTATVLDPVVAWVRAARWFPLGLSAELTLLSTLDLVPGSSAILFFSAKHDDSAVTLQVPVTLLSRRPARGGISPHPVEVDGELRWLVDACADPASMQEYARLAHGAGRPTGNDAAQHRDLTRQAATSAGFTANRFAEFDPESSEWLLITGEQSNTSVIARDAAQPFIMKVFRIVAEGENPDVVVSSALTTAGCPAVPACYAALLGTWHADERPVRGHLAVLSEFVPGAEDAWDLSLADARRVLSGGQHGDLDAAGLGAAVAAVHMSLATALGSETASASQNEALRQVLLGRLEWARREAGAALADFDATLDRHARRLATLPPLGTVQHIHGDLHLGQVLRQRDGGWKILDFEGEPLRPLAERMQRESPLRDVVGILRSFTYAQGKVSVTEIGGNEDAARLWTAHQHEEFLRGYSSASGTVIDTQSPWFTALLLDKALYELVYELANRPLWVDIPLRSIRAALGGPTALQLGER
ncbi:phosphotransferase [Humidisolicoccus flavus]|uniref:phosphotransferase n=1 Tax=Humidisolicoccus flavus TaxID=3111414 RepID=UPI0032447698